MSVAVAEFEEEVAVMAMTTTKMGNGDDEDDALTIETAKVVDKRAICLLAKVELVKRVDLDEQRAKR